MRSNRDLVDECDKYCCLDLLLRQLSTYPIFSFPYYETEPEKYTTLVSSYFKLYLHEGTGPHGYIPQFVMDKMPFQDTRWKIDKDAKRVCPVPGAGEIPLTQTEIIRDTVDIARQSKLFKVLQGWRNELYAITGHSSTEKHINMERAASSLFGINTYGVHMTLYTDTSAGMKVWVPRRAKKKQTYGGALDNTVAGGLSTGEAPFECLIRESAEEADLPEQLVRSNAKACGTVSYFHIRDSRAGGETGLLQPECQFVYDMEVGPEVRPKPNDEEVEAFYLWTVDEVKNALSMGEFKPNCALVLLDFFVRHGILTAENEKDYAEIVSRLHRRLPFPTSQRA